MDLPARAEIDDTIKIVRDHADRIFTWNYERERPKLVTLYNKATEAQWSGVNDLDWATEVDLEWLVADMGDEAVPTFIRAAKDVPGSPIASWTEKEFTVLGIELLKARLSQFVHGEQGALLCTAKIVETVPWIDAKYYAATQVMDEARHVEVFARYLDTKVGDHYPISPFLDEQLTALIEDSRWDIAYLGMQIIIESLALAAFGQLHRSTSEPLLKKLLRYVMSDEARHVAFGILSLGELYGDLSSAELLERQEFLFENTGRSRARATTPEVWERMGVDLPALMSAIQQTNDPGTHGIFSEFQRQFFSKLVPNVRKLGLLDANDGWLRERWGQTGLLEFENGDDTSADYGTYDAVTADRGSPAN